MLTDRFLQTDRTALRAVEPDDLDFLYLRENDSSAWHDGATTAPLSRSLLSRYIDHYTADIYTDRQLRLIAECCGNKQRIGIADLYDFDPTHSRAGVGIYIDPDYRRQGYGTDVLALLCEYAFGMLGMHQLFAVARTDNKASIALFTACGFDRQSLLHDWVRNGDRYCDALLMQCVAPSRYSHIPSQDIL